MRVQNFHPFRTTISRFQDIALFTIFPLTSMLKCHNFFNFWQMAKTTRKTAGTAENPARQQAPFCDIHADGRIIIAGKYIYSIQISYY